MSQPELYYQLLEAARLVSKNTCVGNIVKLDSAIEAIDDERLIDVDFLIELHTELSNEDAESLMKYAERCTITHKSCYGDGSIIYPKWKKSIKSN